MISVTVLAVVCGYFAHEAKVVLARREWLEAHPRLEMFAGSHSYNTLVKGDPSKSPSLLRRWLGDREQSRMEVLQGVSPAEINEISRRFPEAAVYWDRFR